ncbi:MAG: energy transducer TonB, partial [Candidatus Melainabacteria bacterium]|nr:energy transducer TonB [Candidatus Melainabacteria bacterium]
EAVRIADRFYECRDPETIERQGRLQNCLLLVFISHMMMVIAFVKLQEYEIAHPRIIRDVDVNFEFTPPPPEPPPKAMEMPKDIALTAGANINPGSEAAPKPLESSKVDMPAIKALQTQETPTQVPAKPVPSRRTTMAAPVAVTATNVLRTPVGAIVPKQAPTPTPPPPVAGAASNQPLSGTPTQGGAPGGIEGGTGTGGAGTGGTGVGQGNAGAGTGEGAQGGMQIATRLPTGAARAMGNIAPYRKDLLMRLAQNWHPKKTYDPIILLLQIDHDGHLISGEIFQSSGSKKADKEALAAAQATEYAPLPDWYKGDTLTFKIELSKVEAMNQ